MGSSSIKKSILKIISWLPLCFLTSISFAAEIALADQDNWVFSGMVSNEKGERYAYFFQMQHQGDAFKSAVVLFDMQSNEPIFQEESEEVHISQAAEHWQVGQAFLHLNPITGSWVFGLKTKEKQGFNFKIDMMNADATMVLQERLRPGLKMSINQVKALNGHIYLSKKQDQFVTAPHAWVRKITGSPQVEKHGSHEVSGLFCHFNDDSGFYAIKLLEPDALQGALAGRFDGEGQLHPMSQFIEVQRTTMGEWTIQSLLPQYHLTLSHPVEQKLMTVGLVSQQQLQGACLLSQSIYTL